MADKLQKRIRRHTRVRAKVSGSSSRPRVSVFRSNKHVFVQIIDDTIGKTLVFASDVHDDKMKGTKTDKAQRIGELLAEGAKKAGITSVVFDRGGYKYHGRIKAVAEALRKQDIKF